MPLDQRDDGDNIEDLAIDILGGLFSSKTGQPFQLVFDYVLPDGESSLQTIADRDLVIRLSALLRGFIRQELHRLRKHRDPQLELLKRRIKEILSGDEYVRGEYSGEQVVCLRTCKSDVLPTQIFRDEVLIEQVAYECYNDHRTEWCRGIISNIDLAESGSVWVSVPQLLCVMIRVNKALIETHLSSAFVTNSHIPDYIKDEARILAIREVSDTLLPRFVAKGRLDEETSMLYIRAIAIYVDDWLVRGDDIDPKPKYLKEVILDIDESTYANHKYMYERGASEAVRAARDYLRNFLQNESLGITTL